MPSSVTRKSHNFICITTSQGRSPRSSGPELTAPSFCSLIFVMKQKVRVAGGQGFWGDLLTAPVDQVRNGPIDYLMLDYLAEVTMSIVQKQRQRDPNAGYARDFVSLMREILPDCIEKDIKVLSNAGGVNVEGCAAAIQDVAAELGLSGKLRIGVVTGDDILPRLDEFTDKGIDITNMETGENLADIRDKVQSANVYLG